MRLHNAIDHIIDDIKCYYCLAIKLLAIQHRCLRIVIMLVYSKTNI